MGWIEDSPDKVTPEPSPEETQILGQQAKGDFEVENQLFDWGKSVIMAYGALTGVLMGKFNVAFDSDGEPVFTLTEKGKESPE